MTVLIIYDTPEEATAGVLLGYNAIKLAGKAAKIGRGEITAKNKSFFRIDTAPIYKKPRKYGKSDFFKLV